MSDDSDLHRTPDTKPQTRHYTSYEDFYNDIPEEGSLGILAMGFQGVLAWRRKKEELKISRGQTSSPSEASEKNNG